jgi:hypothetical protein
MDASQYKDYVLFMLFIKYVSDKYTDYDGFEPPIVIPKGASFKDMVALKGDSDIGNKVNTQVIQPLIDANTRLARSDFPQGLDIADVRHRLAAELRRSGSAPVRHEQVRARHRGRRELGGAAYGRETVDNGRLKPDQPFAFRVKLWLVSHTTKRKRGAYRLEGGRCDCDADLGAATGSGVEGRPMG